MKITKPSIIFFGTPDFAVAALEALLMNNYAVLAVVTAPDKSAGRGRQISQSPVKIYAEGKGLPVLQPEKLKHPEFVSTLRRWHADLHVVVAFRMLPEVVWNMPPWGTINVHASLLPSYRGAAPINWALINGETVTGVTTFRLQHEIDTGNILLQKQTEISPEDDFGTLYERLKTLGARLLVETIEGLAGGKLVPVAQDPGAEEPVAPKLDKALPEINWEKPARSIVNLIRGLAPVPGAFTVLQAKKLKIFKAGTEPFEGATAPSPGDLDTDGRSVLRFAAADAWVRVTELQYEGKKRMPVADFLRGWKPVAPI